MAFADRVALITGSASGMGKQTARRMAEAGVVVVINDIDAGKVESTVAEFRDAGLPVSGAVADISKPEAVEAMVQEIIPAMTVWTSWSTTPAWRRPGRCGN